MSKNSNGIEIIYWFNSNNGDFIVKKSENEFRLVYRVRNDDESQIDTTSRIVNESEFNFIKTKFGFLPIKSKRFKNSLDRISVNNYNYILYPDKDLIRDVILNEILK